MRNYIKLKGKEKKGKRNEPRREKIIRYNSSMI